MPSDASASARRWSVIAPGKGRSRPRPRIMPRIKSVHRRGHLRGGPCSSTTARWLCASISLEDAQKLYRMNDEIDGRAAASLAGSVHDAPRRGARSPGTPYPGRPRCLHRPTGRAANANYWSDAVQIEKNDDVHHPHADRRGGRVQPGVDAGDGGHRQAGRHRDPAHPGREPALHHADLHGARRGVGHRGHGRRRAAPAGRHRAGGARWSPPAH